MITPIAVSAGGGNPRQSAQPDEERHRETLRRYDLDSLPDSALDDLSALAAHVCGGGISLISLIDGRCRWGKPTSDRSIGEVAATSALPAHVMAARELLVVPDATLDRRFADDSLVAGEPRIRFFAGVPLFTAEEDILGVLCVVDRTPRQLTSSQQDAFRVVGRQVVAQLELRRQSSEVAASEARLRIVTDNARVGLVVVDHDRRYLYANRAYADLLNLPSSDIIGCHVRDVLPDLYDQQISPRLDRAFAGERVTDALSRRAGDGERHYAVRCEPADASYPIRRVAVVITEITEQTRAEQASIRLAAIVESSADAIIGTDLDGIIMSWNRGAEQIFGYTASEMVGASILRLIPADRLDEEARILERIRRGEGTHVETLRRSKDGRLIDVSVTASPIRDASGRVIGASKVARDISERKRAEEDRRFQQAMLTTERELTLDGILVVDEHATVLSVNNRFGRMWGIPQDVLATRAEDRLLHAVRDKLRDPDEFMERVRSLYDRHDAVSHDEVELTDGRVFDRYSAPMRDVGGRYYGRVWYFRDVTERRQVEAELRRERDRAQRYLDTADVMLVGLDVNHRVTSANRKACEVLEWTEEELVGRDYIETYIPERLRQAARDSFGSLLAGDRSVRERAVVSKSGRERVIEWRTTLLRDERGRVAGTFSSGTDVTERNEALVALRAGEERMRFALQAAGIGIWDVDYATATVRWSEILEHQYGLQPGTFAGTFEAFINLVHPDDRAAVIETITNGVQTGDDFTLESRALWPDGTVHRLTGAGRVLLDENRQPLRGIGISTDITERYSLEQQYHQAQKMEAIGRLAGGVAHDFNNLLTVILGFCDLARADLEPNDPHHADLEEIQKAGQRAAALTRQLLAFSRKEIIEPTVLDLNTVTADVRSMLERLIGEDVSISIHPSAEPALVHADPGQMQQIIMNLAVNARDAMPGGGAMMIEVANADLDEAYAKMHLGMQAGRYAVLTVTDTGMGMTPDVQAHLFEPFFTTKQAGKGTGLGLATVHGIVTRSGGNVTVYSEIGRGTSFKVYFPRAGASEAVNETVPPLPRPRRNTGETVLVVEDAEGLRDLSKRLLERLGYTVLVAASASEAEQLFEQNPSIDVVLTDVVMPGESGPDLAKRLVEQRPSLKVIYMSGYTEDAITHHGVLNPGIAFVHKPFTADALERKIREVLDH